MVFQTLSHFKFLSISRSFYLFKDENKDMRFSLQKHNLC